jgi:hypothetical protein
MAAVRVAVAAVRAASNVALAASFCSEVESTVTAESYAALAALIAALNVWPMTFFASE